MASRFNAAVNDASEPPDDAVTLPMGVDRKPAVCRIGGTVSDDRRIMLQVSHEPGALACVLGERSDCELDKPPPPFSAQALYQIFAVAIGSQKLPAGKITGPPADAANAILQAASAFEPANELEGMIAVQAAALHHVTMDCLARAQCQPNVEIRATNLSQANKCARTFSALIETLNRHRGKTTTQRVIVENVTVQAGGQAVVGAVTGVGSQGKLGERGYANTETSDGGAGDGARLLALPCSNSEGLALPTSGGEGQESLPNARRSAGKRRAAGEPECTEARPLHRRRNRGASNDPATDQRVARTVRVKGAAS
ncbi:hypothetical protein ATE48_18650 [Candidatus Viadribacter manganicus]|uniref:Uncharacterized protein n=1 Tax=Candidatus Viadribacter manganicus TaxID=1759059 RepID=A0A1B1AMK3_9PROT|nr:hypothetical protein [Candidatus Viadribacter manganicus]ANP47771.1 hypothetical protein ATE48_18650 [Candidatus Viadribacter manganicus]